MAGGAYFTFSASSVSDFPPGWQNLLNEPAAGQMSYGATLMNSRGSTLYAPDQSFFLGGTQGSGDQTNVASVRGNTAAMVYLSNSNSTVTLDLGRLAATGTVHVERFNPVDNSTTSLGDYPAAGSQTFTTGGLEDAVLLLDAVGNVPPPPTGDGTGLRGEYYDNIDLTNLVLTRTNATVDFDWGTGSPDPSIEPDTFSVRWTGQVKAQFSETYTFYTVSDDGVRLWVNGQLVIDNWTDHAPTENWGAITLSADQKYDVMMEYYENGGGAVAQLLWSSPSTLKQIIPQTQLSPASGGGGSGDSDGDGLPDAWEQQYFGNLGQGPNDDPDGDGYTNLQEYQAGTDPRNAASFSNGGGGGGGAGGCGALGIEGLLLLWPLGLLKGRRRPQGGRPVSGRRSNR